MSQVKVFVTDSRTNEFLSSPLFTKGGDKNFNMSPTHKLLTDKVDDIKGAGLRIQNYNIPFCYTVKGFNFVVLKFRGFLDGDLSRWFNFRGI